MVEKLKGYLIILIVALVFVGLIFGGVMYDRWRWHNFQEVHNSDIGYWAWKFTFDNKNNGVSTGKK